MQNFLLICIVTSAIAANCQGEFSYQPGKCEISLFQVVREMFNSELRALANPTLRKSSNKFLQYDLYTPHNPNRREILKLGDVRALQQSHFNASWPVRFSIHGWTGKSTSCSNAAIKDAYQARGNFNVIIVDWSTYSLDISYTRISKQLMAIAKSFMKFTQFLHAQTGVPFEQMYLIGHSAGSHIAGLAGKLLRPQRYGVIFALDPAGLNQLRLGESYRLAASDAMYVESIHTDVTLLGNPGLTLAQAEFFPNWGQGQPHCPNATATEFDIACDHFAAIYYFAESVRHPMRFGALKCKQLDKFNCACNDSNNKRKYTNTNRDVRNNGDGSAYKICGADAFMGGEPAVPKTGVFYLSTNVRTPYGQGSAVHVGPAKKPTFLASRYMPKSLVKRFYFDIS